MSRMRKNALVSALGAAAFGLGIAGAIVTDRALSDPFDWLAAHWWLPPLLILGIALGQWQAARVVIDRQGTSFALGDVLLGVALVARPGGWVAPCMAIGLAIGLLANRVEPLKIWFNVGQATLGAAAAAGVTILAGRGVLGAAAGLAAFAIINHLAIAVAIRVTTGQPLLSILRRPGSLGALHNLGNISIGLLAGWLAVHHPIALLGLVAPLGLLLWSYHQQTERAAEARLFAELAHRRETAAPPSLDASARVLVLAAARIFGGAEIEVLLRHPDGPVRYAGDESGLHERVRVDSSAFAAPWALHTLGSRAVQIGVESERPFCSAVLGEIDRPVGVFIARRPERSGSFTRLDARLAEVLVGQAADWLSTADLAIRHQSALSQVASLAGASHALGDIGAYTAPALLVLRESTDRLSRLATTFTGPDPVSGIVDELHTVERAVASLLGAIALATEEHRVEVDGRQVARDSDTWTSTGLLSSADLG